MHCRAGCGACCIAPSITTAMPDMPEGKPAGRPCLHLDERHLCRLFDSAVRPAFCTSLRASPEMCGASYQEAMTNLNQLEILTQP